MHHGQTDNNKTKVLKRVCYGMRNFNNSEREAHLKSCSKNICNGFYKFPEAVYNELLR